MTKKNFIKIAKAFKKAARSSKPAHIERALHLAHAADTRINTHLMDDLAKHAKLTGDQLRHIPYTNIAIMNKLQNAFLMKASEIQLDIKEPANHCRGRKPRDKYPRYRKRSVIPKRNAA